MKIGRRKNMEREDVKQKFFWWIYGARATAQYTLHFVSLRTLICWMILVLCHLAFLCTYARLCFCAQLDENWCERALGLHRGAAAAYGGDVTHP